MAFGGSGITSWPRKDFQPKAFGILNETPDPKKLLEDGALKYELALSREAIRKIEEDAEHQLLREKEYQKKFWAMAEGSFSFLKAIEASQKKLG